MNETLPKILQILGIIVLALVAFKVLAIVLHGVMLLVNLALVGAICIGAYLLIQKLLRR